MRNMWYRHASYYIQACTFPHIAGHEISGFLQDGTPVAIEPLNYCGSCAECKQGKYNLCSSEEFDILGATTDGGMTEKMLFLIIVL